LVATTHQHGAGDCGEIKSNLRFAEKSTERWTKERERREGHEIWAGSVKAFRNVGDVKKGTAGL